MSKRDELIEAAATAYRSTNPDGVLRASPAWSDLDAAGRIEAFELGSALRVLEAALDDENLSTTGRAVLARVRQGR